MSIGDYGWASDECKEVPYIVSKSLGKARQILHFKNGKLAKNIKPDIDNEVFFSIQKIDKVENGKKSYRYVNQGYLRRTKEMKPFFDYLIQDNKYNQHIEFIEWDDRYNLVIVDGIYISQTNVFMTKEEFNKFEKRIIPYEKVMKENE